MVFIFWLGRNRACLMKATQSNDFSDPLAFNSGLLWILYID